MTMLRTERLTLRPPRPDDIDSITAYLSDFGVAGNLARVPHPYRRAEAEAWLARRPADPTPYQTAFMIETDDGMLAGNIGFHERYRKVADIGYYLGRPFWGRGIMTEAAAAAIDWYFAMTDAVRIYSGAFHFNMASLAVQLKLGFVEVGRSARHCLARGTDVEHVDTELTRTARAAIVRRMLGR